MGVDSNTFPSSDVNMVSVASVKGKDKVEPSELVPEEATPMATDSLKLDFTDQADLATKLSLTDAAKRLENEMNRSSGLKTT